MKFSKANSKLKKLYHATSLDNWLGTNIGRKSAKVYSFDLLSGVKCPFAKLCRSKAVVAEDGRRSIQDGPHTEFRCFSASQEVLFTNVYNSRKSNSDAIDAAGDADSIFEGLQNALPVDARVVRIHVSGDFSTQEYFNAWVLLANANPEVLFYAYTKSLRFWLGRRESIPKNLVLTASRGGVDDDLIEEHGLRSAKVVFSKQEAGDLGLEIDDDDSHAADPTKADQDFALLIHGVQPKGSEAAAALRVLAR